MFKNVASQKITLLAIDTASNVPKTGDSANITAYVSKDDGAVTVLGDTTATELDATNAPGLYSFDLTQAETNADKLVFSAKSSTSGVRIVPVMIYTFPATGILAPTVSGRTLDVSAGGEAGVDWANVGSPTTTVNLSATTISTSQAVASVSGAVGSVTGSVGSISGVTFPSNFAALAITVGGAVTAGTVSDKTGYSISGTTTTLDAMQTALNSAHGSGSWATATGFSTHSAADVADAVWDEAMSGHTTDGTYGGRIVRATNSNVAVQITGSNHAAADVHEFQPGVITSGDFATDSITSTALAASAVSEIVTGILTTAMTEAYRSTNAAPTVAQALFEILQNLTEFAISGTTKTVKKLDGSTTAKTYTLDSATTPTSITEAT